MHIRKRRYYTIISAISSSIRVHPRIVQGIRNGCKIGRANTLGSPSWRSRRSFLPICLRRAQSARPTISTHARFADAPRRSSTSTFSRRSFPCRPTRPTPRQPPQASSSVSLSFRCSFQIVFLAARWGHRALPFHLTSRPPNGRSSLSPRGG